MRKPLILALLTVLALAAPAHAQTLVTVGSFATNTTGDDSQSIEDVGFQPTAVLFFWDGATADGATVDRLGGWGAATGTSAQWAHVATSEDAIGTSDGYSNRSSALCILVISPATGSTTRTAAFAGFTALGFDLTWVQNEAGARIINYIAVGGDITEAEAASFTLNGSTGPQSVTAGVANGDVLFLISTAGTVDTLSNGAFLSVGMATNAAQWSIATTQHDAQVAANTYSTQVTSRVYSIISTSGTVTSSAAFTGFTPTGFGLDVTSSATRLMHYLVLKGGAHKVGTATQKIDGTGTKDVATAGVNPAGVMVQSINRTTSTAVLDGARHSMGAASGAGAQGTIWGGDTDAADPTEADRYLDRTALLRMMTPGDGTGAEAPTTEAVAALDSFGTEKFTPNWTTADATEREFAFWAVGDAEVGGGGGGGGGNPKKTMTGAGF